MKKLLPLFALSALVLTGCTKTSVNELDDSNNFDSDPIADVTDDGTTNSYDEGHSSIEEVEVPEGYDTHSLSDGVVSITAAGDYYLSGEFSGVNIRASKNSIVRVFLDGATISSSTGIAFDAKGDNAIYLYVVLLNNSTNTITNDFADANALHVKGTLFIQGSGRLDIQSKQKTAIKASKDIFIKDVTVNAIGANHGINGQTITSEGATISVTAVEDGLQAEVDSKTSAFTKAEGFIYLVDTKYTSETTGDGIQADTYVYISGGTYNIKTSGEFVSYSTANMSTYGLTTDDFKYVKSGTTYKRVATDEIRTLNSNYYALVNSVKGIKVSGIEYNNADVTTGEYDIYLAHAAYITINSTDDCIHTNYGNVELQSVNLVLDTLDDGAHADYDLSVNNASIQINSSYEGLEGATVTVDGANTNIVSNSEDDGINAASDYSSTNTITINDGYLRVFANGDGLDANTALYLKGGVVIVEGPGRGNGSLDAEAIYFQGGLVFACSTSGMTERMSATQYTFLYQGTTMASGSKISITNANNESLFSYTLKQSCNQLIFSSPDMVNGGKYTIYSGSTSISTITLSGTLTKVGSSQGGGPGGGPGGGW